MADTAHREAGSAGTEPAALVKPSLVRGIGGKLASNGYWQAEYNERSQICCSDGKQCPSSPLPAIRTLEPGPPVTQRAAAVTERKEAEPPGGLRSEGKLMTLLSFLARCRPSLRAQSIEHDGQEYFEISVLRVEIEAGHW